MQMVARVLFVLVLLLPTCQVLNDLEEKYDKAAAYYDQLKELKNNLRGAKIRLVNGRLVITRRKRLPSFIKTPLDCRGKPFDGKVYEELTAEVPLFELDLRGVRKDAEEYLKAKQGKGDDETVRDDRPRPGSDEQSDSDTMDDDANMDDADYSYDDDGDVDGEWTDGDVEGDLVSEYPDYEWWDDQGSSSDETSDTAGSDDWGTADAADTSDAADVVDTSDLVDGSDILDVSDIDDATGEPCNGGDQSDVVSADCGEVSDDTSAKFNVSDYYLPPQPTTPGSGMFDDLFFLGDDYYNGFRCDIDLVIYNAERHLDNVWQLSADDSNSVISPQFLHHRIAGGRYFDPYPPRNYEFFNYYHFSYDPPAEQEFGAPPPFAIYPQALVLQNEDSKEVELFLQIGLASRVVDDGQKAPLKLLLLIDQSGSMSEGDRTAIVRAAVATVLGLLTAHDQVAMIFFNAEVRTVLDFTYMDDQGKKLARQVLESYRPNGKTDIYDAIGYAIERFGINGPNTCDEIGKRILLFSDGIDNSAKRLATLVDDNREKNIQITGFAVGDGFNDDLIETLTEASHGGAFLLANEEEVPRQIAEGFLNMVEIAAKDIWFLLTLPPRIQMIQFFGEKAIRGLSTRLDEQNFMVNDTVILLQKISLYDPEALEDPIGLTVTYVDPSTGLNQQIDTSFTLKDLLAKPGGDLLKAVTMNKYAEMFAEIKRLHSIDRHADALLRMVQVHNVLEQNNALLDDPEIGGLIDDLTTYAKLYQQQWCGVETIR